MGKRAKICPTVHSGFPDVEGLRAISRFSRTVRLGKIRRPAGTRATPFRAMRKGRMRATSWPLKRTRPDRGAVRPMMLRMVVVFPAPFRPMSATTSPSFT